MGFSTTASGPDATAMGNSTTASGVQSTAMGVLTTASGEASTAMGFSTTASGFASAAMGFRAKALNAGAFVWADQRAGDFASTEPDQFLIRASGGVGIGKNNPATALDVAGTVTATAFVGDLPLQVHKLTYEGGWQDFLEGYQVGEATLQGRIVTLTGMIRVLAGGIGTISQLPIGMRPFERLVFHANSQGGHYRIDIHSDGRIAAEGRFNIDRPWVSLSGISFRAVN